MKYLTIRSVHTLTLAIMLATGSVVSAQSLDSSHHESDSACSNRTLVGDYGVKVVGTRLTTNETVRTLALFHFDGQGGVTGLAYPVVNGNPPPNTPPPNNGWVDSTGTYKINSNCTGTLELVFPPIQFHLVVVDRGRQLYLVTDGEAITGEARKVRGRSHEDEHDGSGNGEK
jgi:hypothetical protein